MLRATEKPNTILIFPDPNMTMTKLIPKLLVGLLCAVLALALPFVLLNPLQCIWAVRHVSYWGISLAFILFLYLLYKEKLRDWQWFTWVRSNRWGLLVVLAVTLFMYVSDSPGFKILFDEFVINLTARELHLHHEAFGTFSAHRLHDFLVTSSGIVDKRPIFFPYVVSLLHTFTGYRVENVFILNGILTVLMFTLLYEFVGQMTSRKHGVFAVLLFGTLPLLAQNTNGGGYEVMNLCLILTLMLTSVHYLKHPGIKGLNLMILSAVLLANNRYESMLYLSVPVVLLLVKSLKEKSFSINWLTVLTPLFALLPLLSNRVFYSDEGFFDMRKNDFFGIEHFVGNISASVAYLFDYEIGDFSNSLLLSVFGVVSLVFSLLLIIRWFRDLQSMDAEQIVYAVFYCMISITTLLVLCVFWGKWTDPMTTRFSLPLHLLFVLSSVAVLFYGFNVKRLPTAILLIPIVYVFTIGGKGFARSVERTQLFSASGYNWAVDWAEKHIEKNSNLIVATSVGPFILDGFPGMPIAEINAAPEKIMKLLEIGIYDNIYVLQNLMVDGVNGIEVDKSINQLTPRFVLEPVAEHRIRINYRFRLSRVKELLPSETPVELPTPPPSGVSNDVYWSYVNELCKVYSPAQPGVPHLDELQATGGEDGHLEE